MICLPGPIKDDGRPTNLNISGINVSIIVAITVPLIDASPPTIIIVITGIRAIKVNDDGSIKVIKCANKDPATPAKKAEIINPIVLTLKVFFPRDLAPVSSSLTA